MITIYKMYADWCGPCRIYNKSFRKVVLKHNLPYQDINVDNDTKPFEVSLLPTTIIAKDGQEIGRIEGALTEKRLEAFLLQNGVIV